MSGKKRADLLLVERGLAESRAKAQALLLAGRVFSGEQRIEKSGTLLSGDIELEVRGGERFVSRGGHKLEGALAELALDVTGLVAIDVGASTGGFTDCLLQHGAARVYAVDVGQGQLAQKLQDDARVIVMDRTNARHLEPAQFTEPIDLIVIDASFISLDKLMPALGRLLRPGGRLLAMVKPQFEAGREQARRHRGVIKDPALREAAIERARSAISAEGLHITAECDSSVPGPKGNVERFVLAGQS